MSRFGAGRTRVDRIADLPDARVGVFPGDASVTALAVGQCLLVEKELTRFRTSYRTLGGASRTLRRAELDGLQESWAGLVRTFCEACPAYAAMCKTEDYSEASVWLERLACCWRRTGEDPRLEGAMTWDAAVSDQAELFAAVELGLMLATSADPATSEMCPRPVEISARMVLLMDATARRAGDRGLRKLAGSLEDELGVRVRRPRQARGPYWLRSHARRAEERRIAGVLSADLIRTAIDTYQSFDEHGERLGREQSRRARESVANIAVNERAVDVQRYALSAAGWELEQPLVALVRSLRRSLILRMSEDAENRAIAMPFGELQGRIFLFNERAKGRNAVEAWDAFRATIQEQSTGDGPTGTQSES